MSPLILIVCLMVLIIGSISDLRTREVPDWLNYSAIIIGLAVNLIYSINEWKQGYFFSSAVGFVFSLAIGYLMFYTGQWGGGDSKMIMAIGALIGLRISYDSMPFLIIIYINILFSGAVYGMVWVVFLAAKNWQKVRARTIKLLEKSKYRKIRFTALILILILFLLVLFMPVSLLYLEIKYLLFALLVTTYLSLYLWIFVKAIEDVSMVKNVFPEQLTEGDWIVNEIMIDNKYICGPKDLGIEKKQIRELIRFRKIGKIDKITIREGIPFVPSFLIAFIYTWVFQEIAFFSWLN